MNIRIALQALQTSYSNGHYKCVLLPKQHCSVPAKHACLSRCLQSTTSAKLVQTSMALTQTNWELYCLCDAMPAAWHCVDWAAVSSVPD
jgi:hypothetical protein